MGPPESGASESGFSEPNVILIQNIFAVAVVADVCCPRSAQSEHELFLSAVGGYGSRQLKISRNIVAAFGWAVTNMAEANSTWRIKRATKPDYPCLDGWGWAK